MGAILNSGNTTNTASFDFAVYSRSASLVAKSAGFKDLSEKAIGAKGKPVIHDCPLPYNYSKAISSLVLTRFFSKSSKGKLFLVKT